MALVIINLKYTHVLTFTGTDGVSWQRGDKDVQGSLYWLVFRALHESPLKIGKTTIRLRTPTTYIFCFSSYTMPFRKYVVGVLLLPIIIFLILNDDSCLAAICEVKLMLGCRAAPWCPWTTGPGGPGGPMVTGFGEEQGGGATPPMLLVTKAWDYTWYIWKIYQPDSEVHYMCTICTKLIVNSGV